ncbi:MAG: hypothetical protein IAG13_07040 [Deltaproteobacteria bacterium]|nr:hypothetical protein [Nannocystaceae bacterium]
MTPRARSLAILPPLLVAWLALGCPRGEPTGGKPLGDPRGKPIADAKTPDAKTPDATTPDAKTPDAKTPDAKPPSEPLGRVLEGPLPIAKLLGKPPAEVQAELADPLGKGMARNSCVRFVPERVWFACKFALQRYGDKSGAYKAIGIEYEDGKATAIAFEGPTRAEGPVEPRAALAYVGLELPGEPELTAPGPDAQVWSWFNGRARLLVDGRQYRVVVSSVGDDWARTKVEIVLNDPLTEQERARVLPTQPTPG